METEKSIRTHCCNCQMETNQKLLLDEFQMITEEIVWRNEQGDESKSVWSPVGSIWTISKCLGCEKLTFKHILRTLPTNMIKYFIFLRNQ